jgi:flagellar biosynthesis regulator FlaF
MGKQNSFETASKEIVKSILEEPHFDKEKLEIKVRAILKSLDIKFNISNLKESDTQASKRLLHIAKIEFEKKFWMQKCLELKDIDSNVLNEELKKLLIENGHK